MPVPDDPTLSVTTQPTAGRLAKIWGHAWRVGVSYGDHYEEQGLFRRLLDRLQTIDMNQGRFGPVLAHHANPARGHSLLKFSRGFRGIEALTGGNAMRRAGHHTAPD